MPKIRKGTLELEMNQAGVDRYLAKNIGWELVGGATPVPTPTPTPTPAPKPYTPPPRQTYTPPKQTYTPPPASAQNYITLPSGQRISKNDPNYDAYVRQMNPPIPTPKVDLAKPVSTNILKDDKGEATELIKESQINQDYLDKVKITYDRYKGQAQANESFVIGAARAAGINPDMSLVGKTLSQVLQTYGLSDKLDDLGVEEDTTQWKAGLSDTQKDSIKNLIQNKPREKWNAKDIANYNFATGSSEKVFTPTAEAPPSFGGEGAEAGQAQPEIKTGGDAISEMYDSLIGSKLEGMQSVDTDEYLAKKQTASIEVEKSRQAIVDKQLIDATILEGISKDQAIPMALISRQQGQYSTDEYLENLKMGMDYNNKLILSEMANGNFLEAQRINKEIANDTYEIQKLQLDKLYHEEKVADKEYERLQKDIEWDKSLAMDGYSYIPDMETYNKIVKDYGITPANFSNFIYKEGEKMYLRPLEAEDIDTQVVTAGGRSLLINTQTGETIRDLGGAYKSSSSSSGPATTKPFRFSSSQKTDMIGAGITNEEMLAIETNLANGYSLPEILDASGLSEKEKNDITRNFTGEKEVEEKPKFLDENFVRRTFEATLYEDHPLSEFDTWGWQSKKKKEGLQKAFVEKEIKAILDQIEDLRASGLTDKEIDKMI